MARIRSIKPEFWTDDKIVDLSPIAKLLFIGIWNFADDEGYIADSARQMQLRIFPGNDYDVAAALEELVSGRLVVRYTSDQGPILRVPSFRDHQTPNRPTKTKFTGIKGPDSVSTHVPLTEDSGGLTLERRGEERRGENPSSGIADANPRPEIDELCNLLADRVEANGSKRPTIGKGWRDAVRLMIDKDGRTPEQIERAIIWCQADEFWRGNVMSMPKLREKYDQLRLAAARKKRTDDTPVDDIRDGILFRNGKPVVGGPNGMTPDQYREWMDRRAS